MKSFQFLLFASCFLTTCLTAQEVITEPSFIKSKSDINKKTLAINLIHLDDTLSLPFIDDFSSNLLLPASSEVTDSNYTLTTQFQYYLLGESNPLNNNALSLDTSFTTVITPTDTTVIANNPIDTILVYDISNYPAVITDSLTVWNNYSLIDSFNTSLFDTLFVDTIANDSSILGVVADYKNLWLDNLVNINSTYAIDMPSAGVATMDAVDHYGLVYDHGGTATFSADSLTSKYINLLGASSVYLSFMVQPGGIGDEPQSQDKLILLFKDSADVWNEVWSSANETNLETTSFESVFTLISDAKYLHSTFQFMFVNFASLSDIGKGWQGNADQWHLDYIILDQNRSDNDAYIQDVCFSSTPTTLIDSYFNVPWTHYKNHPTITTSNSAAEIFNNSSATATTTYQTEVRENASIIFPGVAGSTSALGLSEKKTFSQDVSALTFSSSETYTAKFNVSHSLTSDLTEDIIPGNDTINVTQEFGQHYAYDDGSAEAGYGINSYEGQFALKYDLLSTSEQLTAIDLYINNTLTQENFDVSINLIVWSDNGGKPGDILAETISQFPITSDSLNTFLSYKLSSPITVSGIIYVGWRQLSTELLNIGLDRNTNSQAKMFYNVNGTWNNSSVKGTVMIRPRFGDYSFLNTENISSVEKGRNLNFYPNPVRDYFTIENFTIGSSVRIFNLSGAVVKRTATARVSVQELAASPYLVQVTYADGTKSEMTKFIKR
jgi:hypothetical protein